jgi:hypothetical protein
MTLVLSLATPGYVLQVSDRRISHLRSQTVMPDQNKTVMLCNRMAFSYTGMAVLQTKQTSVWLWEVIQELKDRCSTKAVIDHIAKRADIAVARTNRSHYPNDSDLRHAFVGVGWVQLPGASNLSPMLVRITNYHDPTGREMAIPRSEFHIQRIMIPDREYRLMETGTNQTPREREQLNARIKKHAKSKNYQREKQHDEFVL